MRPFSRDSPYQLERVFSCQCLLPTDDFCHALWSRKVSWGIEIKSERKSEISIARNCCWFRARSSFPVLLGWSVFSSSPPGKAFGILSILPSIESAPFEDLNFTPHPLQGLCRVNRQLPPNDCNFNRQSTEGEILPKTFVLNSFKFQGSVKMLFVALSVFKAIIHPSLLSYNWNRCLRVYWTIPEELSLRGKIEYLCSISDKLATRTSFQSSSTKPCIQDTWPLRRAGRWWEWWAPCVCALLSSPGWTDEESPTCSLACNLAKRTIRDQSNDAHGYTL